MTGTQLTNYREIFPEVSAVIGRRVSPTTTLRTEEWRALSLHQRLALKDAFYRAAQESNRNRNQRATWLRQLDMYNYLHPRGVSPITLPKLSILSS